MNNKLFCPNCGKPVSIKDNYCPNCGYNLQKYFTDINQTQAVSQLQQNQQSIQQIQLRPSKQPMSTKNKTILSIVAIVIILLVGLGVWGNNYYSRDNQISRITTALKDPNQKGFAKLVTTDSSAKITDDAVKPTQEYFAHNNSDAMVAAQQLKNTGIYGQISIVQNGRYWLVFPKYQLKLNTYSPIIKTNHANSTIYLNGKKLNALQKSGDSYQLNLKSVFPGDYNIAVKSKVAGRNLKATQIASVWSNNSINMNIKTATFDVSSIPNGKIYINGESAGTLNSDGTKRFTDYPISGNMKLYVTSKVNGKTIKSETVDDISDMVGKDSEDFDINSDIAKKHGIYIITPKWQGLIDKDKAESLLDNDFKDPDPSDFVSGDSNAYYKVLRKMADNWNDSDKIDDFDVDVKITNIVPAGDNLSQVAYEITYNFDHSDGSSRTQVVSYKDAVFQYDKATDNYKIKSTGNGKIVKDTQQ